MSEPRVILLCSTRFALPSLQQLAFFKQLAVVAVPGYCEEMIGNVQTVLTGTGIPVVVLQKKTFEKKIPDLIQKHSVNTGLMLTFSYRIPETVYMLPAKGFYNVHPGPLPAYRGPDPVFQQIKNKEKYAGVTIHKVDSDFDTGSIVINEMIRLDPADTYGILNEKLSYTAAKLTSTLLKLLSLDIEIPSRVQEESKAVYRKKQGATDVSINWQVMDASTIIALINACNPWNKGAVTKLNGKIIRMIEAFCIDLPAVQTQPPGAIVAIDDGGLVVAAINNQAICVQVVYGEEGFLMAKRLKEFGVKPGARFSQV